jgi:hypothetical protein
VRRCDFGARSSVHGLAGVLTSTACQWAGWGRGLHRAPPGRRRGAVGPAVAASGARGWIKNVSQMRVNWSLAMQGTGMCDQNIRTSHSPTRSRRSTADGPEAAAVPGFNGGSSSTPGWYAWFQVLDTVARRGRGARGWTRPGPDQLELGRAHHHGISNNLNGDSEVPGCSLFRGAVSLSESAGTRADHGRGRGWATGPKL